MKHVLLAAAASLALSTSAHAGLIGDTTNNYDIDHNTPVANATAGAQAGAAAGAVAGATGGNATGGSVGDIDVRGGSATSTLGSLNSFGGDGGSVLGSGNSSSTAVSGPSTSLSGAYSEGSVSSASGGNATATGGTSSATSGPSTSASNSGGNNMTTNVGGDVHERAPVSSAIAIGSAGVGDGMCRFGPGVGAQGITAGYTFSLPIFKDKLCSEIAKDSALIRKASFIAQVAGNEAAVQFIAAKDPEINAAITQARAAK